MEKESSFSFNQLYTSAFLTSSCEWELSILSVSTVFLCAFASHATCQPISFWLLSQPFSRDSLTREFHDSEQFSLLLHNFAATCDCVHLLENIFNRYTFYCLPTTAMTLIHGWNTSCMTWSSQDSVGLCLQAGMK